MYSWFPYQFLGTPSQGAATPFRGVPLPLIFQNGPFKSIGETDHTYGLRVYKEYNKCSRDQKRGTCAYTGDVCTTRGGTRQQYCLNPARQCCIFTLHECSSSSSELVVYLKNERYSNSDIISKPCPFVFNKISSEYCTLRVEIMDLVLPSDCALGGLDVTKANGAKLQRLCGRVSTTVYDIDMSGNDKISLTFNYESSESLSWNMKVTQETCGTTPGVAWPLEGSSASSGDDKKKPASSVGVAIPSIPAVPTKSKPVETPTAAPAAVPAVVATKTPVATKKLTCGASRKFSKGKKTPRSIPAEDYYEKLESEVSCVGDACPVDRRSNPLLESDWWSVPKVTESELYEVAGEFYPIDGRITFGKKTKQFDYPWQVAMYVRGRFHCGGSVIGPREIVTAAHCVQRYRNRASSVKLSVGDYNVKSLSDGKNLNPAIKKIIVHPGYSTRSLKNDIAIIQLRDPIPFSDRVQPVCLPSKNLPLDNEIVTVTGWGRDENNFLQAILMEHSAAVISNAECNRRWRERGLGSDIIVSTMMCMDPQTGDSCKGDSGGPSVYEYPKGSGKFTLVGVVSFGSASCTNKRLPGVYTRIGAMVPWIKQNMTP